MRCDMRRSFQPLRVALSQELKASLFPAVAGIDPNKLLETYLDRLTMYTGIDVADQTFTVLAMDAGKVIAQTIVPIHAEESMAQFEERMHQAEHRLIVEATRGALASSSA